MNPYLTDILAQPEMLLAAIAGFSFPQDSQQLRAGDFDRILMTGMGASLNAAYPACLQLSRSAVPVMFYNTAELLHYQGSSVGPRTLLWINSQSGRSAEIVHLLEQIKTNPPACLLACVNDIASPLAEAADVCLPLRAGAETSVSTKTYLNTLAINLLAARHLAGQEIDDLKNELASAARAIEDYLADWEGQLRALDRLVSDFENLFILGRGASMSAVWNGSLINKEAAKCSFEGLNAAEFRHGPLELARPGFCALIFAGDPATRHLNRKLALDISQQGGRAIWLDCQPDPELPTAIIPETGELARPLAEILPMELLTLAMAGRKGIAAGSFQFVDKITAVE